MIDRLDVVDKLLRCIGYCEEQWLTNGGEILDDFDSEDFDLLRMVVTTIIEED